MAFCTVQGNLDLYKLSADALQQFKIFLISLSVPRYYTERFALKHEINYFRMMKN